MKVIVLWDLHRVVW